MTVSVSRDRRKRAATAPLVGIWGGFGGGNIGNDASMEAVLSYLRNDQPDAVIDIMTSHPDIVKNRYGIAAVGMGRRAPASGSAAIVTKVLGRGLDTLRIASWVRRHDVVIVPGMGVLETTLPMRPWGFPYSMFVLGLSGRIFRTKVALVSVGSNVIRQPLTRWLFTSAARLATYRSYRDTLSRDAMRRNGADTRSDHVYIDLAFSIPVPPSGPGDARTVGIGVMDFYGTNDDRSQADAIHDSYLEKIKTFARWLVDHDYKVRLLVGDTNGSDDAVVEEIAGDLRAYRPDLDHEAVVAEPVSTFADLMRAMAPAHTVLATRYHNLICALMLSKPTLSVGYGAKNAVLMEDMGLAEYSLPVSSLDSDDLIKQFTDLESRAAHIRQVIMERNAVYRERVERQFAELSAVLFR